MTENSCTYLGCLVPLLDVLGPITSAEAEKWAASEGVELRRGWDGRLALVADDAAVVYERATAAAEAARKRNEAKTAALAAASYGSIPKGKPIPPELDGVSALEWLKAEEWDERLDAADERFKDYTSGGITYYPINPEQG